MSGIPFFDTPRTLSGHFLDTPEPGARRGLQTPRQTLLRLPPGFRGHSWALRGHFGCEGPERLLCLVGEFSGVKVLRKVLKSCSQKGAFRRCLGLRQKTFPGRVRVNLPKMRATKIDARQITHLICARLQYDLYDFSRGCFGPPSCCFLYERPKSTP